MKNTKKEQEAVVYNGKIEVRRYSLAMNGENFVELANELANKKQYVVKLEDVKEGIKCPSCGHVFTL